MTSVLKMVLKCKKNRKATGLNTFAHINRTDILGNEAFDV
jgi:hypothetical protein